MLRTERLLLRPLEVGDVGALWPVVSDVEFPRFMMWNAHKERSETATFIAAMTQAEVEGAVLTRAITLDGKVIGIVGLHDITRVLRAWRVDRAELGFWVAPMHQRRGFVTEAARELMRYAFEELDLHKVTVGCIADNVASRRVIEKLRFRFLCEQRDHMFRFGRWWSHRAYELCVDEWER
jgi:ribosomal-protein-alanine N-acetyltransferase